MDFMIITLNMSFSITYFSPFFLVLVIMMELTHNDYTVACAECIVSGFFPMGAVHTFLLLYVSFLFLSSVIFLHRPIIVLFGRTILSLSHIYFFCGIIYFFVLKVKSFSASYFSLRADKCTSQY